MASSSTISSTSSSLYNSSASSPAQQHQRSPNSRPSTSVTQPKYSRTYRIAVVGYCSSFSQYNHSSKTVDSVTAEAGGAGKSCMCQRMVHIGEDAYRPNDHTSVLNLTDFAGSPVINNEHYIYWGCARRLTDDGTRELRFEIVEHTEFVDDSTFQPHRSAKTEAYIKRCTRLSLSSPGKLQYFGKNQLGIEQEYPQNLMLSDGSADKVFSVDGFVVCYDVGLARANITTNSSSFDANGAIANGKGSSNAPLPASCADQTDLVLKLLQAIVKQKRPVVLATTKNDELYRPLAREAEKLVGRKEFKGSVPLIETSAHRNVSISDVFMILAHLIDRTTSSSSGNGANSTPLLRAVNYAEACRILGEKCAVASDQFEVLVRSSLTATSFQRSATYETVKACLENDQHFTKFVELFGENCARRKINQHLQILRDQQAQLRTQQQLQDLRNVFPKILPDVRVYTEGKWPSWQDCIKSLPTYHMFFVNVLNPYHSRDSSTSTQSSNSPATAHLRTTQSNVGKSPPLTGRNLHHIAKSPTIANRSSHQNSFTPLSPSSSFLSLLPDSILYHPEAEKHFMAYVDVASARQRHILACENFMHSLRSNPYVVPGRSLHDVVLLSVQNHRRSEKHSDFFHDEQFGELGDDKKLELYAAHQRQLIERSKLEFKDYLWENINIFLHVLLVMPKRATKMRNRSSSKKPTNMDGSNHSLELHASPTHKALNPHDSRLPTSASGRNPLELRSTATTATNNLLELQSNSLHAEIDMIDSLLSSLPTTDNKPYRALDYLQAERERMLSQHVWLLRSSMPEVCPGPLTYCADLYTASVLDSSVRSPFVEADADFCRPTAVNEADKNRHKLIVCDRTHTRSVMRRLEIVLRNGVELDDGFHTIDIVEAEKNSSTQENFIGRSVCLQSIDKLAASGDYNGDADDEDACFVYVYDDYDSIQSLFVQLCGRTPPPVAASIDSPSSPSATGFPSPSFNQRRQHGRRHLALIVYNGAPSFSTSDVVEEDNALKKQQEFFNLFQLGIVLAEQLGCIFAQVANVSLAVNDDDAEMSDQQLLTSLQSLLNEHSVVRAQQACRTKKRPENRRRQFSASSSHCRRPSAGDISLPLYWCYDGNVQHSSFADLHIRLCFMCGDMHITRHVLMCVLRYYFCSRINIVTDSSCKNDAKSAQQHHSRNLSFVSSNSSSLITGGGGVHDNDDCCNNNNSNCVSLDAVNIAPRSIAFDVYLPAPPPSATTTTNSFLLSADPGFVSDAVDSTKSDKTCSLLTLASHGSQRKRYRVHLHFTSYHEVLRQLCCNATPSNSAGARLTSKKASKQKKPDSSSLTQLNSYCSCTNDIPTLNVIPDDGFILVYNAARRASFVMAQALGSEIAAHKNSLTSANSFHISLLTPPVMMLAISAGLEWSSTETDLIRDGISLCEDLQGRWLTCSLLDPIPKIAFDHFWKSCWERRNALACSYEVASTATVHSSMNSISMTSLGNNSGCGFYYAAPAAARPSVSEHEEDEFGAVENPTYGTCTAAAGKLENGANEDDNDYDEVDDHVDGDEEEEEDQPSAETIILPLLTNSRRQLIKIANFGGGVENNDAGTDSADDLLDETVQCGHTATWQVEYADDIAQPPNSDEKTGLDFLALPGGASGSRRPSRTEVLRSKFEAEQNAVEQPPPAVMRRSTPNSNKTPPQRPPPTVTHTDSNKRFSANFSGAPISAVSAAMSTSAYNEQLKSLAATDELDDENNDTPPPLPGRLRNSSKYAAIMGQLNVNIQHTHQQKTRLANFAVENDENSAFDLGPSKPGADSKKKKKRKPVLTTTSAENDQADGNQMSSAAPKKISMPFSVMPSSSASQKTRMLLASGDNSNSYNLGNAAAAALSSSRGRRGSSSRLPPPPHHLLGADAAWHDDVELQQQKSGPPVQLLSVKGLTPSNSRRGSRNEQQPPAGLVLPTGSSGKMLPNARFVLPPVSPRVALGKDDEDDFPAPVSATAAAPLSPVSVGGNMSAGDKSKRSVGSLFGGGNDNRLRKSFDSKKRLAWKKESKAASTDAANSSTATTSSETFEELAAGPNRPVPKFIELCIEFIEKDNSVGGKAMELEGLYRIPGNRAQAISMMTDFFCASAAASKHHHKKSVDETNRPYTLPADMAAPTVCTALKMYLNERTPPLLPKRLVDALVQANFANLHSTTEKAAVLRAALNDRSNISLGNYAVLRYIAEHLHRVSRGAHRNCMTAKNLSICWWPTMCRLDVPDLLEFEKIRGVLEDAVHVMIEDERKVFAHNEQ